MDKFLCDCVPSFLLGIYLDVELLGHLITVFKLLRTIFLSGCTILHSHLQCMKVPVFSISLPTLVIICLFFIIATLVGWKYIRLWFDLHCSDNYNVEHLYMCFLAICRSILEIHLFRCISFKTRLSSHYWVVRALYSTFWIQNLYQMSTCKYSSTTCGFSSISWCAFEVQNFKILMKPNLSIANYPLLINPLLCCYTCLQSFFQDQSVIFFVFKYKFGLRRRNL